MIAAFPGCCRRMIAARGCGKKAILRRRPQKTKPSDESKVFNIFSSVNLFAIYCDSLQLQKSNHVQFNISSVLIRYLDNQSCLSTQFESLGLVDEIGCPVLPTLTKHSLGSLAPVSLFLYLNHVKVSLSVNVNIAVCL